MKKLILIPILLCVVATSGFAQSVIPQVMSFQGYVAVDTGAYTDTTGNALVTLVLYDDSVLTGNAHVVWTEPNQPVKVFRGYYSTLLDFSSGWTNGVVRWSKQYWLDATILNQELSPRVQLTSSAYSFVADTALHVASSVPIGTIEAYAFDLAQLSDSSWLPCDGRTVAKKDYPIYYQSVGNTYGNSTTDSAFLPDLRGLFLRGVNQVNNQNRTDTFADPDAALRSAFNNGNAGNKVGSLQDDAVGPHEHLNSLITGEPWGQGPFTYNAATSATTITYVMGTNNGGLILGNDPGSDATITTPPIPGIANNLNWPPGKVSTENRPKNAYVYWIIKVK